MFVRPRAVVSVCVTKRRSAKAGSKAARQSLTALKRVPRLTAVLDPKGHGGFFMSLSNPNRVYTAKEVARLFAACDKTKVPEPQSCGMSPADWWRIFLVRTISTGRRLNEILADHWWPSDRRIFYIALRDLFEYAGIDIHGRPTFHGLRRFALEQQFQNCNRRSQKAQSEKGGAVA